MRICIADSHRIPVTGYFEKRDVTERERKETERGREELERERR